MKAAIGDGDRPEHFAIEQAPENLADLVARNADLLKLGITPIWYPKGEYNKVEAILRHARCELKYNQSNASRVGSSRRETNPAASTVTSPLDQSAHPLDDPASPQQTSPLAKFLNTILTLIGIKTNTSRASSA